MAKGGHSYSPDVVLAEVGDIIEFQFYPTNHSVIRAAYGYPCVPYEDILGVGHYGFFSGFHPVEAVLDNPPNWTVRVNDTEPIFYYCGAPNSCIGYGMVGVINPNASTSLEHQRQLAEQSTFMLLPGQDWPNEGSIPSGVATTSRSASPTATSAPATLTPTPAPSSHGLGGGAIAGIAIGGAAVLIAAGVAIWFCGRQSRRTTQPAAPAQEAAYPSMAGTMYAKPGHMSVVSGYTVPPGYEGQYGMRSPTMGTMTTGTPVDPMLGQQPYMMNSGSASPNLQPAAPAYGQNHIAGMYAVGTHNVAPVEMDTSHGGEGRRSMEKKGVEKYS